MADGLLLASQFVAAGLLLLLALGLLAIKFNSRVNRAFALYLMLEGLAILLLNVARFHDATEPTDLWRRLAYYPLTILPVALLHFLVAYRRPIRGPGLPVTSLLAALFTLALVGIHAAVPCSFECIDDEGGLKAGFLLAFAGLKPLLQSIVALVLVVDVVRGNAGIRGTAVLLVALAFGLLATFDAGLGVGLILKGPLVGFYEPGIWILANRLVQVPAFAIALVALGILFRDSPWQQDKKHARAILAGAVALVLLSILSIVLAPDTGDRSFSTFLGGFWRTLLPAVVAYALVRHRLFDIDLKLRASLVFALVAAAFGGTYFLVSEGLEAVVSSRFGTIGGLVAAGLLTFLAKPLTVAARKIAKVVVPGIHGLLEPDAPGLSIYRAQFLLFNEDGFLTQKERRLLEHLRKHLKVSQDEASQIELHALQGNSLGGTRAGSSAIK